MANKDDLIPATIRRRAFATHDTYFPVVFYSQIMAVAFGMNAKKDAALDQNIIKATKLEEAAK